TVLCRQWCPAPRHCPSYPTRRSSDLAEAQPLADAVRRTHARLASLERDQADRARRRAEAAKREDYLRHVVRELGDAKLQDGEDRSEEHTSELQSRENLVCRLLLEKKK